VGLKFNVLGGILMQEGASEVRLKAPTDS
jgi:hypothetical protein